MSNTAYVPPLEVLVVEDDFAQLQLFTEVLKKAGIQTTGCLTAFQALDALQAEDSYRLVVINLKLSGQTSGFELAEIARSRRQGLTVLFVTGSSKEMAYRLKGADQSAELLLKPFKLGTFVDRVATLLIQQRT